MDNPQMQSATKRRWSIAAGGILLGAALSGQGIPLHHTALAHPVWTAIAFLLAWILLASRFRRHLSRGFQAICAMPRGRFNLVVFGLALLAYVAMARGVFKGIPRIDDGMASLFQGRIFARGALVWPLPELPHFYKVFGVLGVHHGVGHWCGMYPPGWPLLLVPGIWLGVPWLINPVLGALLVVATGELGRNLYGDRTGRIAALLVMPSPFLLVLSGLHLSHIPTMLFLCLALLALRRLWAAPQQWLWGLAAGLSWGIAFLCRPLDAVVVGVILALGFLTPFRRLIRCPAGMAAGLAAGLLAAGSLLAFQHVTTGDWRTPGHELGMGDRGKFGFVQLTERRAHTPERGIQHTFRRLRVLNENVLGWALPSLAVVLLPFLLGRARTREVFLLLPLPALLVVYAHFWYYEECYPARYISASFPYLFVLAARGLTLWPETVGAARFARIPAFLVLSGVLFWVGAAPSVFGRIFQQDYYDVENVLPRVVRDYGITNAIVFMDAVSIDTRKVDVDNDYYATGFMRNDLDLRNDVLFVRNLRRYNYRMARHHPGRDYYLYRYHRRTEKALLYRLVFEGEDMQVIPIEPETSDLLPP